VRNLWQASAGTSYQDVFQKTVEDMKRERFAQRPGISRPERQAAFQPFGETAKSDAGDASVPVLGVTATGVQLGGGAAAGITVGSVYQSGNSSLRITAVEPTRALAAASGGAVKAGDRARLIAYRYPTTELRVSVSDLAPANRTAIGASLSKIPGVRVVETRQDFAHLLVRPAERGGYNIFGMDGAIRHTVANDPAAITRIISQESGAHQLSELENPARPFALEFGFGGNTSTFKLGDDIQFKIRAGRDGYLTIVDLGTDGMVNVIYPNEFHRDNRVRSGQEITLPTAAMNTTFQAQAPTGRGIVRAFLTEKPLTLNLVQADAAQAAQVASALRAAVGGTSANAALPVGNWATASVVYTVVPK
jgi:hypothetical protein